jgi:hypothetical protein
VSIHGLAIADNHRMMKRYLVGPRTARLVLAAVVLLACAGAILLTRMAQHRRATDDLIAAIERGDLDGTLDAIERGADVNDSHDVVDVMNGRAFRESWSNVTPLYRAASIGSVEIVRLLLHHGARVDASVEPAKWTPLHRAAMFGDEATIAAILDAGADSTAVDLAGKSPFDYANRRYLSQTIIDRLKVGLLTSAD